MNTSEKNKNNSTQNIIALPAKIAKETYKRIANSLQSIRENINTRCEEIFQKNDLILTHSAVYTSDYLTEDSSFLLEQSLQKCGFNVNGMNMVENRYYCGCHIYLSVDKSEKVVVILIVKKHENEFHTRLYTAKTSLLVDDCKYSLRLTNEKCSLVEDYDATITLDEGDWHWPPVYKRIQTSDTIGRINLAALDPLPNQAECAITREEMVQKIPDLFQKSGNDYKFIKPAFNIQDKQEATWFFLEVCKYHNGAALYFGGSYTSGVSRYAANPYHGQDQLVVDLATFCFGNWQEMPFVRYNQKRGTHRYHFDLTEMEKFTIGDYEAIKAEEKKQQIEVQRQKLRSLIGESEVSERLFDLLLTEQSQESMEHLTIIDPDTAVFKVTRLNMSPHHGTGAYDQLHVIHNGLKKSKEWQWRDEHNPDRDNESLAIGEIGDCSIAENAVSVQLLNEQRSRTVTFFFEEQSNPAT